MREIKVISKQFDKRERKMVENEIIVRLCDTEGCDDRGSRYYFAGNLAYCAQHKHLAEERA
jgi:hypothetical protein